MRKHNKTLKAVAFVLLVTLIALILVSSTYAKYTTELTGTDTAIVANFSVGGDTVESFALFDTINEADTTSDESDVADDRIAPGTGGSFEITVENSSEVTVEYSLTISETSNASGVPIEYSIDGTNYYTASDFTGINAATDTTDSTSTIKGTLDIGSTETTSDSITVYWRWAYEGSSSTNYSTSQTDDTDTALGTSDTAPEVTVTATAVFTQVD